MDHDFSGLRAMFINCTLKRSPELSHTEGLVDASAGDHAASTASTVEVVRAVDHDIATGVYPDMTEHGWDTRRVAGHLPAGDGQRHPRDRRADLARRQLAASPRRSSSGCTRCRSLTQRRGPVRSSTAGSAAPDHRQRGRHQALRAEHPLLAAAHRLHDPAAGRRRLDRRGRVRARRTSTRAAAARRTTSPTATPRS